MSSTDGTCAPTLDTERKALMHNLTASLNMVWATGGRGVCISYPTALLLVAHSPVYRLHTAQAPAAVLCVEASRPANAHMWAGAVHVDRAGARTNLGDC